MKKDNEKVVEFKRKTSEEELISLANKIKVIQELVEDGIISEKEGFRIRKKLTT